jgi:hypothetical protein
MVEMARRGTLEEGEEGGDLASNKIRRKGRGEGQLVVTTAVVGAVVAAAAVAVASVWRSVV